MKKVTVADIAKSLGVSKTLVSLVLNNKGPQNGISQDTQKKVWDKAAEMKYKPNLFARGLRMGKSNTIGLIVADISNPFYARLAREVENCAEKAGYNLIICSTDENEEKEKKFINLMRDRQVDGLIISSTLSDQTEILNLKRSSYPFVLIDRYFPRIDSNYVVVDNYEGAYQAVEHLLKIGYRRIAHLTISPSYITSLRDRAKGYKDALKKYGIRYNKNLDREISFTDTKENVKEAIKEIVNYPNDVQAIFVANNNLAVACLECLNEMNLMIPRDIAVVSFDDIPLFAFTYSPITAVSQPVEEICAKAVEILDDEINQKGTSEKQKVVFPARLVVRHSCGRLSGKIKY